MANQSYRPLLTIHTEWGAVAEFDDPDCISRAVEGFCPYGEHWLGGEKTEAPVRLELHPGGWVRCPFGTSKMMLFEWSQESG